MKRLEGEVTALLEELGESQSTLGLSGMTVDPHQFLGIEVNPWAAAVSELVLWIGFLQWHFRTYGKAAPSEPVLKDFKNIECRDAVLTWSERTARMDDVGKPVSRWDGVTTIRHPVTGEEVPDPSARTQVFDYSNPKPAKWPEATFIVGNPPFIGASRMRDALGDGYVEALWNAYAKLPQSADFVMFWWEKAAVAARAWNPDKQLGTRRFGLITTNSLRQTFNRRVLEPHLGDPKKPLSLVFAIPDHPWVDTLYGAAVRIAMTVGTAGSRAGRILHVLSESKEKTEAEGRAVIFDHQIGKILGNLQIGADIANSTSLASNRDLATRGVMLFGSGFIVSQQQAKALGHGEDDFATRVIKSYRNGRDLLARSRAVMVIDLFGYSEAEVRASSPRIYQHLRDTVWPERSQNNRKWRRENWWLFGEPLSTFRPALDGLSRYIVTVETSKFRTFQFLSGDVLPDNKLVAIALERADALSVLSSRIHVVWSLAAGSWLGVGNDPVYAKTKCFDTFPFPELERSQAHHLADLGEQLDAHRKRQLSEHPKLTLTQMYNILEKLRAGDAIEGKDKEVYEQGLVGILKDIHDQIDAAVSEAYRWPVDLSDEDILTRLVDLNRERTEEEASGLVRWLRPDYQNPAGRAGEARGQQAALDMSVAEAVQKAPWPNTLPAQIAAVREALDASGEASPEQIARRFMRARTSTVQPLLESLAALGHATVLEDGRFAA